MCVCRAPLASWVESFLQFWAQTYPLSSMIPRVALKQARQFSTIQSIHAREIIDSRGNPTVEVDLVADDQKVSGFVCVYVYI